MVKVESNANALFEVETKASECNEYLPASAMNIKLLFYITKNSGRKIDAQWCNPICKAHKTKISET
jgi:hypothetical protein